MRAQPQRASTENREKPPLAKAVLVCLREPARVPEFEAKLRRLNSRVLPDTFAPNPPRVAAQGRVITAIYNPVSLVTTHGASACLGIMLHPADDWHQPGADIPDGNFALFRADESSVEVVADITATHTVWYAQTEAMFVASTSQRAIVALLGDFRFNDVVSSWMISSGMMGPDHSWDKRIRKLHSNARLTLDQQTWQMRVTADPIPDAPLQASDAEHRARMRATLESLFRQLDLDPARWVVSLSGGVDSRMLYLLLNRRERFTCIGIGLREALDDPQSDAAIAKRVAEQAGSPFRYFETDIPPDIPMEELLRRFLVACEGRIDHMAMYINGLRHWQTLFEEGIEGLVMGDQNFGRPYPMYSLADARAHMGLPLLTDYPELRNYAEFGLPEQTIPAFLQPQPGETAMQYSIRLYMDVSYPLMLSPLNDLKAGYVEVFNPFVMPSVIRLVRTLPDHLLQRKRLVHEMARELKPRIPIASRRSERTRKSIARMPETVALLRQELRSSNARILFSERLLRLLDERLVVSPASARRQTRFALTRLMPGRLVDFKRRFDHEETDFNLLAWRAYIVSRMYRMLSEDAAALRHS